MRRGLSGGITAIVFTLFVSLGIILSCGATAFADGDIEINADSFKDGNFRSWVLSQSYGEDGILTQSEIADIKSIDLYNKSVKDLQGIEFFTELEILDVSCNYTLESMNLKTNTKLKDLKCYSCFKLTSLDLSANTKLETIDGDGSGLTYLNVMGLSSLQELDCHGNSLTSLDLSGCTSLKALNCSENSLTNLIVSGCTALEDMDCSINKLSNIDLSKNKALVILNLTNNQFSKVDLSRNGSLKELSCAINSLSSIDVSKNTALEKLSLSNNLLTGIDVSKNDSLLNLYLYGNQLTKLNVSKNASLERLDCAKNLLTEIDLSKNTALKYLECSDNKITDLDVSNTALNSLYCNNNQLTSLDIEAVNSIGTLYCSGNNISDLKVNNGIKEIGCSNNRLKKLDLCRNKSLRELYCYGNEIDTVYLYKKNYDTIKYDSTSKLVYLSPEDWEFTGFTWTGSSSAGYKDPMANFKCMNIDALDHTNSYRVTYSYEAFNRPATCTNDGLVIYHAMLDNYQSLDGTKHDGEIEAAPKALGHSWGDWKVTKKPTLTSDGEETRVCKNDPSHKQTRPIPHLTPTPGSSKVTLSLDKKTADVICGKTLTLKATLKGSKTKISWRSSDTNIATVDSNGKITAKQAGSVTITASAAGKSAECKVTVLYKDVTSTKDFWYAPTNYLTAKGVVKGYDKQTKFKPANDCTRAQMVTFLYRLQGEPKVKSTTCKFTDVKKTDYFFKPVIWAVEKGITTGISKTKFGPQGVCTRAQTVTFLWRMAQKPAPKAKTCKFKDVKTKDYFYKSVIWASEQKIVAGYADGTFKPQGKCLRRQMVTFLYKYDKFVNGKG
ncbi:MAG: leucine-rich repeat domain-containing protein [Clostridiales bacterium]|nr:leucine-rich repeat domain-containing protein [Clostridiales bacterium]